MWSEFVVGLYSRFLFASGDDANGFAALAGPVYARLMSVIISTACAS